MADAAPRLRSQVAPALLAYLAAHDVDVAPILRRFDLPASLEQLREIEIPLSTVHELGAVAEQALRDPFVGLHVAEWLPRGAYGLVEFIVRSARDMREAASRLVRHTALLNEIATLSLVYGRDEATLVHRMGNQTACAGRHGNELVVAMMVRVLRESMRLPLWRPRRVAFAHALRPDVSALLRYFGVSEIEHTPGKNELAVALADFDLPLQTADAALLAVLDEQAMRAVASRPGPDAFWSALRERVRIDLRDGPPRLDAVAAELGIAPRTLQRRLEEQKTTFQDLVDDLRRELACMYLGEGTLAPLDVAFLLGYSDGRAFARAFKRWTGTTPAAYRRR